MASPMRGRWHGEAVTDEVGPLRLRSAVHLISRLAATASPPRGSHWRAHLKASPSRGRWLGEAETERLLQICGDLSVSLAADSSRTASQLQLPCGVFVGGLVVLQLAAGELHGLAELALEELGQGAEGVGLAEVFRGGLILLLFAG